MKELMTSLTVVCSLLFLVSCAKEINLPEKKIPEEIKSYITTHFPDCSILKATKDRDENDDMYEVSLSCGVKLEFNKQKNIIDIDGISKLPDSVIPAKILSYVTATYPNNYILGWEIQSNNQEVQLDNHLELVFNMSGDFLRISN